jgi:hypothetical protein
MSCHDFQVYADSYSFFIQDEASDSRSIGWPPEARDRKLSVAPGVIAIGTVFPDIVDVSLELMDSPPTASVDAWDDGFLCSALSAIAVAKGQPLVAEAAMELSADVAREFMEWFRAR